MTRRSPTTASLLSISCCLALVFSAACDRDEKDADTGDGDAVIAAELPPGMSPGTLRGLGPHVFEATFDQAGDRQGAFGSRDNAVRLAWSDLDSYSFREIGGGRVVREELRVGADVYRRGSDESPYVQQAGVPGDSLILQRTVQMWESALAPFGSQVAFDPQPDSTIEGRPVKVWRLTLVPAASPGTDLPADPQAAATILGRTTTPLSLSGLVSVDVATGNRLLAELEGRFLPRADIAGAEVTDEVHITYRERRILLDVPEDVFPPSPDQVRKRQSAPARFHPPKPVPKGLLGRG